MMATDRQASPRGPPLLADGDQTRIEALMQQHGLVQDDLIPDYSRALAEALAFAAEWQAQFVVQREQAQRAQAQALMARVMFICCRVYVGSLAPEVTRDDIAALFAAFGGIRNVEMSVDTIPGRHKGYCFIEFESPDSVPGAIATLNGVAVAGRPMKVSRPSNYPTDQPNGGLPPPDAQRVFIANVHSAIKPADLAAVFEPFGTVTSCTLAPPALGSDVAHRGFGYIVFEDAAVASTAAAAMNGFSLAGLPLYVVRSATSGPIDQLLAPPPPALALPAGLPKPPPPPLAVPVVAQPSSITAAAAALIKATAAAAVASAGLDDASSLKSEESVTISSSTQRMQLIQRLARSHTVLLLNMAMLRDMDADLEDDVKQECERFDAVESVKMVPEGRLPDAPLRIFVRFATLEGARRARDALDGRFFAGRPIKATFHDDDAYERGDYFS